MNNNVYSVRDNRLSFMQDATLRDKGQYRFYLYDKLERTVVQGLCNGCNWSEEINIAEFKENIGSGEVVYPRTISPEPNHGYILHFNSLTKTIRCVNKT